MQEMERNLQENTLFFIFWRVKMHNVNRTDKHLHWEKKKFSSKHRNQPVPLQLSFPLNTEPLTQTIRTRTGVYFLMFLFFFCYSTAATNSLCSSQSFCQFGLPAAGKKKNNTLKAANVTNKPGNCDQFCLCRWTRPLHIFKHKHANKTKRGLIWTATYLNWRNTPRGKSIQFSFF